MAASSPPAPDSSAPGSLGIPADRHASTQRRVCLFGGSFDPVHSGHLAMAKTALEHCCLDRVVFLPASISPFKQADPPLFSAAQRLELLRLAIAGEQKLELSDLDLLMPPPSWTWRLVERWKQLHQEDILYWLMGTDQWDQLHRWARFPWLAEQLHFIVYLRGETPAVQRPGIRVSFIEARHPASSSGIRRCLREHLPLPPGWMNPAVAAKAWEFYATAPCILR